MLNNKVTEAPEKIILSADRETGILYDEWVTKDLTDNIKIEYIRIDVFIDKVCEFLKSYRQEIYNGQGYIAGIINDETIEDFKNYIKGEPVNEKKCMFTKDNYTDEDRKVLCEDCDERCEYSKKEEPVSEPNKELAETYLAVFDKKFPVLPTLKGKQLADYKNFLNKCQQIFSLKEWGIYPIQAKLFKKLSLLWAVWGAEHLKGVGKQDEKEQDIPVSKDLEEASYYFACKCHPLKTEYSTSSPNPEVISAFKAGAQWQEKKDQDAVEIAREEIYKWLEKNAHKYATIGIYTDAMIIDLKQIIKDK